MGRPQNISEAVWAKAEDTLDTILANHGYPEWRTDSIETIARAILAAVEEEREAQKGDFTEWLRGWVKKRFGVWITHNTVKGAYASFLAIRNRS